MDKLVYLHELDSVRNSADEMEAARRALYQEIVCNGNTVVITMNQLADSRAFLGLVAEDDGMLTAIKGLMLNGAIKISRYGDKRTASQYLQDNLQPTPAGSHGKFVLSGWDIPDELDIEERESIRDHIYRALRNSDTAYLELKKRAPGDDLSSLYNENAAITVQRYNDALDKMERLVSLMLAISDSSLSYVDVNAAPYPRFDGFLDKVIEAEGPHLSNGASSLLRKAREQLQASERRNRSPYYRMLQRDAGPEGTAARADAEEATRALDLCYNLTTEASIRCISGHYNWTDAESLASELQGRLESYQRDYDERRHSYPWEQQRTEARPAASPQLEDWEHALRIREAAKERRKTSDARPDRTEGEPCPSPLYETHLEDEGVLWRTRVRRALVRNILIMVLYAVILSFVEVIVSLVQDLMVSWMNLGNDAISDMVSDQGSLISIVIFLTGIFLFSRSKGSKSNRTLVRRAFIAFLGTLFVIVLPVLSVCELGSTDGALTFAADLASLPDMLFMGIPSLTASFIGVGLFAYIGWLIESKMEMPGIIDSAVAALASIKDLLMFTKHKSAVQSLYINERTKERNSDAESKPPFDLSSMPNEAKTAWERYLDATAEDDEWISSGPLEVIKDHARVLEFERSPEGRPIGITYESPYNRMVVDLVQDAADEQFAYERIIPMQKGAVVIVPLFQGRFVLLQQFRHALRGFQLSFPRGYGEAGLPVEKNAAKELREELGVEPASALTYLGTVIADSGLSGNRVAVFMCDVPEPKIDSSHEGIEGYETFTSEELDRAIKDGTITDGFTLSALSLLRCHMNAL